MKIVNKTTGMPTPYWVGGNNPLLCKYVFRNNNLSHQTKGRYYDKQGRIKKEV